MDLDDVGKIPCVKFEEVLVVLAHLITIVNNQIRDNLCLSVCAECVA